MKKFTSFLLMLLCAVTTFAQEGTTLVRIPHSGWIATAQNEYGNTSGNEGGLEFIVDEDEATFYHSDYQGNKDGNNGKQGFMVKLAENTDGIAKITYKGRSDGSNTGWATKVRIYIYSTLPEGLPEDLSTLSVEDKNTLFDNATVLGTPVFDNNNNAWASDKTMKTAEFAATSGQYILFIQDEGYDAWLTCADFQVYKEFEGEVCTVNYEIYYNGKKKATQTIEDCPIGEEFPNLTTLPDYVVASKPSGVIESTSVVDGQTTIRIDATANHPFEASNSFEDAIWYIVDMHSNDTGVGNILNGIKKYVWTYYADAEENIQLPQEFSKQTSCFGDDKLWCFVGNVFDGFKIYNKAAGSSLTLNKANDGINKAEMSDATNATIYKLVKSNSSISNAACFLPVGHSYYLNTQATGGVKCMRGWNQPDGGSSCRFFAPTDFVQTALTAAQALPPTGAVGSSIAFKTEEEKAAAATAFETAMAAITADAWNTSAITPELTAILTKALEEVITFVPGALYRVKNVFRGKVLSATEGNRQPEDLDMSDIEQIWKFEATGNNYKLQCVNYGENGYMKGSYGEKDLTTADSAGVYTMVSLGDGQYNLRSGGGNLVIYSSGQLGGWSSNPKDSDGAWLLFPATELEVSINEFASICLPFDVTTPDGVTAHAVENTDEAKAYVSMIDKEDIPAGQGAILSGNGTFALNIAEATSDWTNNLLRGTTTASDIVAAANTAYYVLANVNGIGFYQAELTDGTFFNNANKAYLPITTTSAEPAAFYSFNFDWNGTTGIENIKGAEENAVKGIYDITGRKIETITAPGIYIINGKKCLVK